MSCEILGHQHVLERFQHSLSQGRLASTFLFVGPPGIGKRTVALHLAQCLLCEATPSDELVACQSCPGCVQVSASTHPDLIVIDKPDDKSFIPVESFIGDREHRMREGLCHDIALKPFRGGRRIAIIDDADYLNQEGANCLLKTLEEPPDNSLIILIGTSEQQQLPTIRSRCQIIRFAPLAQEHLQQLLRTHNDIEPARIEAIARRAEGSLSRAIEMSDVELEEVRRALLEQICQRDFDAVALAKSVNSFVEAAGKDAPPRRARLRQLAQAAADFYRQLMRQASHAAPSGDPLTDQFVTIALAQSPPNPPLAAASLDRCFDCLAQIESNANVATLVTTWLDDLAQLALRGSSRSSA